MEGRRSFVSSRSFAKDHRPVPNIVAIYEKPRYKIRRDATHVQGGMFGWNTQEEATRALRMEVPRAEEEVAATPDSATPVDPALAGPSQRCGKRPTKRSKRRGFAPLVDMGATILSLHYQELMRRRQEGGGKQEQTAVAPPAKRPLASLDETPAVSATPPSLLKARASSSAGDPPTTKKLRLTINTIPPPIDTSIPTTLPSAFLQMPPSPPDTSSNASKAPAEGPTFGPNSTSTPKGAPPQIEDLNPFEFDSLALFPPDSESESDSDSESTSESSSELDSDSPDLSSSTSTRSTTQTKGKQKRNDDVDNTIDASDTFSAPSVSVRGPSTPPKKKRPTHKPGWIGWVQTEESPDHSRLIRLDDAPVILGRRTRSGREFKDPPPLPPSRRKSIGEKPKQDLPQRQERPRPKPTRKAKKPEAPTGEKSKQQSAWQEAQRRAANGGGDGASTSTAFAEPSVEAPMQDETAEEKAVEQELAAEKSIERQPSVEDTDVITATAGRPEDPSGRELAHRKATATPKPGGSKPSAVTTNERDRDSHSTTAQRCKPSPSASREPAGTDDSTQVPTPKSAVAAPKSGLIVSKNSSVIIHRSAANEPPSSGERAGVLSKAPAAIKDRMVSLKAARKSGLIISSRSEKDTPSSQSTVRKFDALSGLRIAQVKKPQPRPTPSGAEPSAETTAASSSKSDEAATTHRKPALAAGMSGSKTILSRPAFPMAKRKDPPEQLPGVDAKKRKLVRKLITSSSDESSEPRSREGFSVNPFDRRAKRMELTRKGVKGDAFDIEMKKWYDSKRNEWRQKEKEKSSGEGEKSGSDARSGGARTVGDMSRSSKAGESGPGAADHSASKSTKGSKDSFSFSHNGSKSKDSSNFPRDPSKPSKDSYQSDNPATSPKIRPASSQLVWNGDWGMDVAKVSVSGLGDNKSKFGKKLFGRRESDVRREAESGERKLKEHTSANVSTGALGSNASLAARAPKPKPRVQL
ncbi:hypothetical protein BDV93DRAFT_523879 [Ceratobasidium sp. AG-I]|nr:hypothetical protein BDV93DRAFT_523879 [Ceratobasidium sp. AG-I]